ncbi:MAG: hypothetical protein Kow00114_35950 [Kiloniellaceae bacterium]
MSKTMRVRAGVTAQLAGIFYGPGWVMEMSTEAAAAAAAGGDWEAAPVRKPAKPVKPEGDDLTAAIAAAIGKLAEGDFGKDGVPNVKPLEKALGYDVTAAERDAGWAAFQAQAGQ